MRGKGNRGDGLTSTENKREAEKVRGNGDRGDGLTSTENKREADKVRGKGNRAMEKSKISKYIPAESSKS